MSLEDLEPPRKRVASTAEEVPITGQTFKIQQSKCELQSSQEVFNKASTVTKATSASGTNPDNSYTDGTYDSFCEQYDPVFRVTKTRKRRHSEV